MQPPSRIDHVGIAVHSLEEASRFYRDALGLTPSEMEEVSQQKVRVVLFQVGEVRIELLEPTAHDSPIAKFLQRNGPGLHHVAYRVADLRATLHSLAATGVRLIDDAPRHGAHGMNIAFIHPKSTSGVLTELCQPAS